MTRGEFDRYDLLFMPLFLIGSLYTTGWLERDLPIIGDPGATFYSLAGAEISIAALLSLVAFAAVFFTNDWDFGAMSGIAGWVTVATFGLIIAPPLSPVVSEMISGGAGGIFAVTLQTSGYSILSYTG